MTRPYQSHEEEYNAYRNSYECWALAVATLREQMVRERRVMPVSETERLWREQGPRPVAELDTARVG